MEEHDSVVGKGKAHSRGLAGLCQHLAEDQMGQAAGRVRSDHRAQQGLRLGPIPCGIRGARFADPRLQSRRGNHGNLSQ